MLFNGKLNGVAALGVYLSYLWHQIIATENDAFAEAVLPSTSQQEEMTETASTNALMEPQYEESFKISAVTLRTLSSLFNVLSFLFAKVRLSVTC